MSILTHPLTDAEYNSLKEGVELSKKFTLPTDSKDEEITKRIPVDTIDGLLNKISGAEGSNEAMATSHPVVFTINGRQVRLEETAETGLRKHYSIKSINGTPVPPEYAAKLSLKLEADVTYREPSEKPPTDPEKILRNKSKRERVLEELRAGCKKSELHLYYKDHIVGEAVYVRDGGFVNGVKDSPPKYNAIFRVTKVR